VRVSCGSDAGVGALGVALAFVEIPIFKICFWVGTAQAF
jgi:hypothetical protein